MLLALVAATAFATYQPATVAPPIAVPPTRHCTVALLHGERFINGEAPHLGDYAPPAACPGPWAKVVLTWRTRIAGRQYDRIGALWIGRREIYRFTTAEPTPHGIDYTVSKDVTAYAPVLREPQSRVAELGNFTNKTYTGIYTIDASLTFYQAGPTSPAPSPADLILPIDNENDALPWFALDKPADSAQITYATLPRNIEHAALQVYSTSHGCDEFAYTNQSDAYAAAHKADGLCGGGPYREIDVRIDGKLASVIYPFPWIYTGGINPMLWRPLSAIDTLNIPPYRVDLDPFAGVLSDGRPHTFAISVFNDRGDWPTDANLFLWRDKGAAVTGGAIVRDTIPQPSLPRSHEPPVSARAGDFSTTASAEWYVSGYVETSHGRVRHSISTFADFTNRQHLDLDAGAQTARQFSNVFTGGSAQSALLDVRLSSPNVPKGAPYDLVIDAHVLQARFTQAGHRFCYERVLANALYKRAKNPANTIARGTNASTSTCTGRNAYHITKRAVDGALTP